MFHGYKLGQKITDDNDDLYRGQRQTELKCGIYVTWSGVPLIQVKDDDDLHESHPKVIKDKMSYGFRNLSEEPQNQIGDTHVLNYRSQMLTEVKCSKVYRTWCVQTPNHLLRTDYILK